MNLEEIKRAILLKKSELEIASFTNKPHEAVRRIYSHLKELQYQMIQAEIEQKKAQQTASTP